MIAACSVAVLVAALVAVAVAGPAPLVLALGMSVVIGFGWPAATGIAARHRHNVIMTAAGVAAALLVQFLPGQQLVWLPAVVGVALMTVFAAELVRGEGAEHRLESAIASTAGVLAAVSSSGWIALADDYRTAGSDTALLVVVGAVVAGFLEILLVAWIARTLTEQQALSFLVALLFDRNDAMNRVGALSGGELLLRLRW